MPLFNVCVFPKKFFQDENNTFLDAAFFTVYCSVCDSFRITTLSPHTLQIMGNFFRKIFKDPNFISGHKRIMYSR